jgi:hypothetical protein
MLGALAYTVGPDIMFGSGMYAPRSHGGLRLLAHELAHVVQQPDTRSTVTAVTDPNDASEKEAEAAATAVVSGGTAVPLSVVPAGTVQRQFGDVRIAEHRDEVFARLRIDYAKARQRNRQLAAAASLGWGAKLATVAHGRYRDLATLWANGDHDAFADAVARHQFDVGLPEREIDGILGLATWSRLAGLGEAIAAISTVSKDLCYQASEARLERGHRLATGRALELPPGRNESTFQAILATFPNRMRDMDVAYRGAGAAGALVYAGLGSFVSAEDMWNGGLRPGAAMQVWEHQRAYDLLQAGMIEEGGRRRRLRRSDADFSGTSFVFLRYDSASNERVLVRHFDSEEWHRRGDYDVWVAANTTR